MRKLMGIMLCAMLLIVAVSAQAEVVEGRSLTMISLIASRLYFVSISKLYRVYALQQGSDEAPQTAQKTKKYKKIWANGLTNPKWSA